MTPDFVVLEQTLKKPMEEKNGFPFDAEPSVRVLSMVYPFDFRLVVHACDPWHTSVALSTVFSCPAAQLLVFTQPDPDDWHKWHASQGLLSVTGAKFMNWNRAQGGGGAPVHRRSGWLLPFSRTTPSPRPNGRQRQIIGWGLRQRRKESERHRLLETDLHHVS